MIKEDEIVMCTVKKIEGTTIFLEIEGNGEGSMSMSEVAAGRIRNLREYVSPNKKIVCKVLRIIDRHPQLSLRRVTGKERESVLDKNKKEKTLISMLKVLSKDYQNILDKIKEKYEPGQFLEEARENPKIISNFFKDEEAKKFTSILSERKEKEKIAKKTIIVKSHSDSGINDIKSILETKEADIRYLGSSKFMISIKAKDFKEGNLKLSSLLQKMEENAKKKKIFFEIKEK